MADEQVDFLLEQIEALPDHVRSELMSYLFELRAQELGIGRLDEVR